MVDTLDLVVVEAIGDAPAVEPGARLLHRVAVLDAVDGDRHSHALPALRQICAGSDSLPLEEREDLSMSQVTPA
ncbi:hypothetical protein D3C80_2164700 [compost metagenome]